MDKSRIVLLRTLIKSTSRINRLNYCKDRRLWKRTLGGLIGLAALFLMIVFYSAAMSIGYGYMGMAREIPLICAAIISMLSFFFTFFKTNGYLFNFKEYDMLMSLPFEPRTIAACKFLYMYVASIPWYLSVAVAMLTGYAIYEKPNPIACVLWLVLSMVLPIIPMLIAAFIGFLIAKVSSGFRKRNIIQTVLTFAFAIFCFSFQYIIQAVVENNKTELVLSSISEKLEKIGDGYLPIKWFANAIREYSILDTLLLIGLTAVLFEALFILVGKNYRQINSAMKSHAAAKAYKVSAMKKSNMLNAIAFKEFKRLTGTHIYMINGAMGEVLSLLLSGFVLFVGFDKLVKIVTKGAPMDSAIVLPAIPLIVYFLIGMVATTAISPSIEGKNYWILQSMPIEKKVIYQGKMLFNLYLTVPFAVLSTVCMCISAKVSLVCTLIYIVEIIALCCFSTAWGCCCGIRHMRLDWENEIEVVKQGAAVAIYLFPNMLITMGLIVLVVALGLKMDERIVSLILVAIIILLAILAYIRAIRLAKKMG